MGSFFSCCREDSSEETEPLIPESPQQTEQPVSPLDRTVDILVAFETGKLPSQDQLNHIIQVLINSSVLHFNEEQPATTTGRLSENGKRVLNDFREVLESIVQLGMERNMDDKLQDIFYQCSQIEDFPIRIDIDSDAQKILFERVEAEAPEHEELVHDTMKFIQSLKAVSRLLLTSATFRLLLSDIFEAFRELVAGLASNVGDVASQVQVKAEAVERAANTDLGSINILASQVGEAASDTLEAIDKAKDQPQSQVQNATRDIFIAQVQNFLSRAHQDPRALDALRILLHIVSKYARKLSNVVDIITSEAQASGTVPATHITPKHETLQLWMDLKTLLQRLASGHSLDPVLKTLELTIRSVIMDPVAAVSSDRYPMPGNEPDSDLNQYLQSVHQWLSRALSPTPESQPHYATSSAGTRALENLYDGGRNIYLSSSSTAWNQHLHDFLEACDAYTTALTKDRSTARLLRAFSKFQSDLSDITSRPLGLATYARRRANAWKDEALHDLFGWVLPRVAALVGRLRVPMPRVEYVSGNLRWALEAPDMGPGLPGGVFLDLFPDRIRVRTCNEVQVDMSNTRDGDTGARISSYNRLNIHVDGARFAVRELGYFFRYGESSNVFGYADQGVLSMDVGSLEDNHSSEGLSLDIEVALDSQKNMSSDLHTDASPSPLFDVLETRVELPGVHFKIEQSKHWLLNKLIVQPLAAPMVSRVAAGVLEARVREMLEGLASGLAVVHGEAQKYAAARNNLQEPGILEYWEAFLEKGREAFGFAEADDMGQSEAPSTVETHTTTTATLTGIVHTTSTTKLSTAQQAELALGSEEQPTPPRVETETSVAIGAGAMLFPDNAGPYTRNEESENISVVDQLVRGTQDTVSTVQNAVSETVEEADDIRVHTQQRREERLEAERLRDGWRSCAFDI
ncbi:hypothetical protein H0H81_000072 [Sphagnurus paluster]|uniref:HAM1-like N-terminal domain-containing protein n=1 Tax=Sphagnurus paluster TaxID=117069 RepID=A0A9P7GWY7_9AGAR|nr:hypothetical protein H0H81_000072 [Sphagnurus paluster]